MARWDVVITCEHASNRVPAAYTGLFRGAGPVLGTHRGFDIGAASLARAFARGLGAPLFVGRATRLLVDLNRSETNRTLFSEFTRGMDRASRDAILARHYRPYRDEVTRHIEKRLHAGHGVLHLSVHSFTPVLDGRERYCDVGLLYDPKRAIERRLAADWRAQLARRGDLRVRRNYPYAGVRDGFVPWLSRRLPATHYAGLELEVNQAHARRNRFPAPLENALVEGLRAALASTTAGAGNRA